MVKQEGAAAAGRIRLPLKQTVFLPKEAMGVRYIDKVRSAVFVEKVSRGEQGLWLRGFWELDLEYQGTEAAGLRKHRVGLPLKVQAPQGWPEGAVGEVEPGDVHIVIRRPMIQLLSPYVLEFSADLQVDYLGECRWQEDRLPVWHYQPSEVPKEVPKEVPVEKPVDKPVQKPVETAVQKMLNKPEPERVARDQAKEQIWAPRLNKNRFRSILTAAALARLQARGEDLTEKVAEKVVEVNSVAEEADVLADVLMEEVANEVAVEEEKVEKAEEVTSEVVVEEKAEEVTSEVAVEEAEEAEEVTNEVAVEEKVEEVTSEEKPEAGVQLVNGGGVRVRLAAKQLTPPRQETARPVSAAFAIKYYVVKPGDDAMHIALKHNISLERLREANRLPEGELAAGTLLRIPR